MDSGKVAVFCLALRFAYKTFYLGNDMTDILDVHVYTCFLQAFNLIRESVVVRIF